MCTGGFDAGGGEEGILKSTRTDTAREGHNPMVIAKLEDYWGNYQARLML